MYQLLVSVVVYNIFLVGKLKWIKNNNSEKKIKAKLINKFTILVFSITVKETSSRSFPPIKRYDTMKYTNFRNFSIKDYFNMKVI